MKLTLLLCYLVALFVPVCWSEPQSSITWYRPDFPPANFVDGLMEDLGYNDQTQKFLAQYLTKYRHTRAVASYKRVLHNLRYGDGCVIGLYKNEEREKFLIFSVPSLLTFPNGLVLREQDFSRVKPYLGPDGFISIDKLIENKRLVLGIADGRSYSGAIDQAIKWRLQRPALKTVLRSGENVFTGLLNMLDRNRIDLMFGYPEELEYYSSLGVLQNRMKFIPIEEMPQYEQSYIACSKNAWGEQVIADINEVLLQYRAQPEYLRFYEFWLDFDSKKRHSQLSQQLLK